MTAVLDRPMTPNRPGEAPHPHRQAADVKARLAYLLAVARADRRRHPDRAQPLPLPRAPQALGHRHLDVTAVLLPAVTFLHLLMPARRHPGEVVIQVPVDIVNDRLMQGLLV